jgi:hypothetical protein
MTDWNTALSEGYERACSTPSHATREHYDCPYKTTGQSCGSLVHFLAVDIFQVNQRLGEEDVCQEGTSERVLTPQDP